MKFKNLLITDIMKLKSTPFLWVHLLAPILALIVFLSYFSVSTWDPIMKQKTYMTAMCMAFPVLIAVITSMVAENEYAAGNYQNLLGTYDKKWSSLLSKYLVLVALGGLSTLIGVMGFYLGFSQMTLALPLITYVVLTFILIGCSLFLYAFHLFLSLRFSKSVSIGIGIFEALIAALFRTGMGDGRWPFFPCSWSIRFTWFTMMQKNNGMVIPDPLMGQGVALCVGVTMLSILMLMVWFENWEAFNIYGIAYNGIYISLELTRKSVLPEYREKLDNALHDLIAQNGNYNI